MIYALGMLFVWLVGALIAFTIGAFVLMCVICVLSGILDTVLPNNANKKGN
jgi:hypothetical protein